MAEAEEEGEVLVEEKMEMKEAQGLASDLVALRREVEVCRAAGKGWRVEAVQSATNPETDREGDHQAK